MGENPGEGPGSSFKVKIQIDYCCLVFFCLGNYRFPGGASRLTPPPHTALPADEAGSLGWCPSWSCWGQHPASSISPPVQLRTSFVAGSQVSVHWYQWDKHPRWCSNTAPNLVSSPCWKPQGPASPESCPVTDVRDTGRRPAPPQGMLVLRGVCGLRAAENSPGLAGAGTGWTCRLCPGLAGSGAPLLLPGLLRWNFCSVTFP